MRIKYFMIYGYKRFNGKKVEYYFDTEATPNIVRFVGPNGSGKSTILNALSPLPDPPSDIVPGTKGCKELIIINDDSCYSIRYDYNPSGSKHVSSASIMRIMPDGNSVELCESGNISTAKELIKSLFNFDANYEILSQMSGYNKNSIVAMTPGERKKFMSGLIDELAKYNDIYKALNKRSSTYNALINSINNKISLISMNKEQLDTAIFNTEKNVKEYEYTKHELEVAIAKESMTPYEIQENEKKKKKAKGLQEMIGEINTKLGNVTLSNPEAININSDLRLTEFTKSGLEKFYYSIDEGNKILQRLLYEASKKRDDINRKIEDFESSRKNIDIKINLLKSNEAYVQYTELDIDNMSSNFSKLDSTITDINTRYETAQLTIEHEIDDGIIEVFKNINALYTDFKEINTVDYSALIEKGIFDKDGIVNRGKFFNEKYMLYHEIYETNSLDRYERLVEELDTLDDALMASMNSKLINKIMIDVFMMVSRSKYDNIVFNHAGLVLDSSRNIFEFDYEKAVDYIDTCIKLRNAMDTKAKYIGYIDKYLGRAKEIKAEIVKLEKEKAGYDEKHYKSLIKLKEEYDKQCLDYSSKSDTYEDNKQIVKRMIDICSERDNIENKLTLLKTEINYDYDYDKIRLKMESLRDVEGKLENAKSMLYKYKHDRDMLMEYHKDVNTYQESSALVDTLKKYSSPGKGGIQVTFIAMYISNILKIANSLLSNLFDGRFVIAPFVINDNEFRIPIMADGYTIDDVSSMSTSQMAMISICINMALMAHESVLYRIPKFDEADGPLDPHNRSLFPDILKIIIEVLGCEQAFLVSQNTEFTNQGIQVLSLPER